MRATVLNRTFFMDLSPGLVRFHWSRSVLGNDASTRAARQFLYRESLKNGVAELQHLWTKVCRQAHDKVGLFPLSGGTFGSILCFFWTTLRPTNVATQSRSAVGLH